MTRAVLILAALALAGCGSPAPDATGDAISRMGSLSPDATHKTGGLKIDWVALLKEIGSADSTAGTR